MVVANAITYIKQNLMKLAIEHLIEFTFSETQMDCDGKSCGLGRRISAANYICPHNNLAAKRPDLMLDWDYDRNTERPENLTLGSNKYVWWKCHNDPCGCHRWRTKVANRSGTNARGCPFCFKRNTCIHSSLLATNLPILLEWDHERNEVSPAEIAPHTNKSYWWKCLNDPCGCHRWQERPNNRISFGYGCPFCSGQQTCVHSSLQTLRPDLAAEWDYERNDCHPSQVAPLSNRKKYWWICKRDPCGSHRWKTTAYNRCSYGCPHCAFSKGYSKAQIEWIKRIEIEESVSIQHALWPEGEYKIPGVGKVDGFCRETNTVYEYHGDYFHGNPNIYHPGDFNERVKKTFGELYDKTVARDKKIKALGYNLVIKWDTDFDDYLQDEHEIVELIIDPSLFRVYACI